MLRSACQAPHRARRLALPRPLSPALCAALAIVFAALVPTACCPAVAAASDAGERPAVGSSPPPVPGGLGEVAAVSSAKFHGRGSEAGVSPTRSATSPYWACPEGPCDAIIDPFPVRAGARYALRQGGPALEGGGVGGGYDPQDLQSAYKIPAAVEEPQTIALVDAFGYEAAESDLATYRATYGLEPCTKANGCFRKVNQNGEEANYPPPEEGWQGESALDLDMASAACANPAKCHILLVEATTPSLENLGTAVNEAVKLGASEISNSYGLPEQVCPSGCVAEGEKYYNHPGVVVTASSGDAGYNNYLSECERRGQRCASPSFPATSRNVLAVGGTSLHKASNSRGWSEGVWAKAGSGCSQFEVKPPWQTDTGCAQRTGNDVAAIADNETPVSVRLNGAWYLFGGTSAASPLVAGIEAHASKATRALAAHAFYEQPSSLFDVTIGGNGTCTPPAEHEYFCHGELGYDGPTGLGTPDGVPVSTPPSVTKLTPGEGPAAGGTAVTITGANFTGASAVKFGSSNAASFEVSSASSIKAVSPTGTG